MGKSLDPPKVIVSLAAASNNPLNKSMQSMNSICSASPDNEMETTILGEIKQLHRFIQFKVDIDQLDDVNKHCQAVLDDYVSNLCWISHQTSCFNANTKQCTFYILVNDRNDGKGEEWSDVFLKIAESYSWIKSN